MYHELVGLYKITGLDVTSKYFANIILNLPEIVKTQSLFPADRRMGGWIKCKVDGDYIKVDVESSNFGLVREILSRQCYFSHFYPNFNDWNTVIDLGANIGIFTALAACKAERTIAVEAQGGFKPSIQRMVARNQLKNVDIVTALVGEETGSFSSRDNFQEATHSFRARPKVITFRSLLQKYSVDVVDFLKIDIEGSEFSLFRDPSWLEKVNQIGMEVHPTYGNPLKIKSILERRNFEVKLLDGNLSIFSGCQNKPYYIQAKTSNII